MPRVTRAALRSKEIQEESDLAASTPLPSTPIKPRAPLGEISNNKVTEPGPVNATEEKVKPSKKGKGKKAHGTKKMTKQKKDNKEQPDGEVLEDGNESTTSSAVEEACRDLLRGKSVDNQQTIVDDQLTQTPPSAAVTTASQQLSPKAATPYFNPEIHKADELMRSDTTQEKEDSFVANIGSRTPAKMSSAAAIETQPADDSKDDSFVQQFKTGSPSKRISRIEDSVEALDVLEEEIEKVGGLIPTTTDNLQSPVKVKKDAKSLSKAIEKKPSSSLRGKNGTAAPFKSSAKQPSTGMRPAASRPSIQPTAKKIITPKSNLSPKKPEFDSKSPAPVHAAGAPPSLASMKKRVSSVHKAPFQPTKSTKPPTRASFELPGDAVARKLKEQREERQKREEEEKPKQHVFKARPVRVSHAPEVKLTTATKLRLSMAKGASAILTTSTEGLPNAKPGVRTGSLAPKGENKRLSRLTVAKRTTTVKTLANSSARVTRGPSLNPLGTGYRNPSASGAPRAAPTAKDLAHQKVKGKEIFGRSKVEIQEREKAKKEKEEAAKKARIDAAERGRVASREWAEKQKSRKMEAEKANAGAKEVAA